jgi:hypothetical protein
MLQFLIFLPKKERGPKKIPYQKLLVRLTHKKSKLFSVKISNFSKIYIYEKVVFFGDSEYLIFKRI